MIFNSSTYLFIIFIKILSFNSIFIAVWQSNNLLCLKTQIESIPLFYNTILIPTIQLFLLSFNLLLLIFLIFSFPSAYFITHFLTSVLASILLWIYLVNLPTDNVLLNNGSVSLKKFNPLLFLMMLF
jgi:hypothetical protein